MQKKIKRVYVDASAVGGKFNTRLADQTKPFWDAAARNEFVLVISDLLELEIRHPNSPQRVRDFLVELLEYQTVRITTSKEVQVLATRYITENVVGESSFEDCEHVALATLSNADVLVSWNLKHLVQRSEGYKNVNKTFGYAEIDILTPVKLMEEQNVNT